MAPQQQHQRHQQNQQPQPQLEHSSRELVKLRPKSGELRDYPLCHSSSMSSVSAFPPQPWSIRFLTDGSVGASVELRHRRGQVQGLTSS